VISLDCWITGSFDGKQNTSDSRKTTSRFVTFTWQVGRQAGCWVQSHKFHKRRCEMAKRRLRDVETEKRIAQTPVRRLSPFSCNVNLWLCCSAKGGRGIEAANSHLTSLSHEFSLPALQAGGLGWWQKLSFLPLIIRGFQKGFLPVRKVCDRLLPHPSNAQPHPSPLSKIERGEEPGRERSCKKNAL
jgi:hypothetical protein